MRKKGRRYDTWISFVVQREVKELIKAYCEEIEFYDLSPCMRYILKKYFEFISSRKVKIRGKEKTVTA